MNEVYAPEGNSRNANGNAPVFVLVGAPTTPYDSPSAFALYIDKRMPESTVGQMREFFEENYGVQPGTEKVVSIKSLLRPDLQVVTIPGLLSYKVHFLSNDVDASVQPYLYPWLRDPNQWTTREVRYKPGGRKTYPYSGTNSLVARFDLGKPELSQSRPQATCAHHAP